MTISLTRAQWVLITVLTLATTPYFLRLGVSSLWDSNEAFYAETPREMVEAGDYVNPTFNYRARLNKPPLSYWIVAPFYRLFGVSETVERLPIVLAAIVLIATAYGLGRVAFSVEAGLFAAIGLAASPRFLMFSRRIMIDVYLAMFMGLALLFFVVAERRPDRRRLCLMLMYGCVGLGVITKGPVAAVLPAAALVVYLALKRRMGKLREIMLPIGLVIVAVIVLPWYIAIYLQHGWGHIETFLLQDNLSRYAQEAWGPHRSIFFYARVILGDFFPWSLFLIPLLWFAIQRLWRFARKNGRKDSSLQARSVLDLQALLGIWVVVIAVFFSLSKSKEDLYVLPVYPAAAALVGSFIARVVSNRQCGGRSALRWSVMSLAFIILAGGMAILYLFVEGGQLYRLSGASVIGFVGIIGGIIAAVLALRHRVRSGVLTTALTMIVCNWIFVLWTLPDFERYRPVRSLCEVIAAEAGPDALVGYYRAAHPSMAFYLRRPIFECQEQSEIEAVFSSGKPVFCVMTASDFEATRKRLGPQLVVLASHTNFKVKLKGILNRDELPQMVLISNKSRANSE